jgi:hypothetical protein
MMTLPVSIIATLAFHLADYEISPPGSGGLVLSQSRRARTPGP